MPYATSVPEDYAKTSYLSYNNQRHGYYKLAVTMQDMAYVLRETRPWHLREQASSKFIMHPATSMAIELCPPNDWHQLLLEWPHIADMDDGKIAYTRDERNGEANRQVVTSVGKYLTRHFSMLPENKIRDIAAMFGGHSFEVVDTMEGMLAALKDGPGSCMVWRDDAMGSGHPYNCYAPELGWRLAIRKRQGQIMGRALMYDSERTGKIFVRSYQRNDGGYSGSDEGLETWMTSKLDYTKQHSWRGAELKHIPHRSSFLAPYLDGEYKNVEICGKVLVVCEDGDWICENTGGYPAETNGYDAQCACCNDEGHEEDMPTVEDGDSSVCESCLHDSYVYATGRRGNEYYIHRDNSIYVESQDAWYDENYADNNGIIMLSNGDWETRDNAVYLDARDEWVHCNDEDAVYCENSSEHEHIDDCVLLADGDYALENDAWMCEHSGDWYLCDEATSVTTACGKIIHPDHADEYVEQEPEPTNEAI